MTLVEDAPCKINLTLDVFAPRADGFHDLDSLVAVMTPADRVVVTVSPSNESGIELVCSDPTLPTDRRNLAYRAAADFLARFVPDAALSVQIRLDKHLPHQAGLGGGSSDAAAVLRALSRQFPVDTDALQTLAGAIGSDVPLFLADTPFVRMQGRGERLSPVGGTPLTLHGVLVKPEVGVLTGPAYALLDALPSRIPGAATGPLCDILSGETVDAEQIASLASNDFEAAVLPAFPEVARAHRTVAHAGALRALLCGSGAAIFGFARDTAHANALATALRGRFPFVEVATTIAPPLRATEKREIVGE